MTPSRTDESDDLRQHTAMMLRSHGLIMEDDLEPLTGGGNNRVYLARGSGGPWLIKHYFRDPADVRDRLATEWAFTQFAWNHHIVLPPRPNAMNERAGLAAFEYIAGRKLEAGEVRDGHVAAAADFVAALAECRGDADARALPEASEACFSLADHCVCVDRRVARLTALPAEDETDARAQRWVQQALLPAWHATRRDLETAARCLPSWADPLSREQRVLSPSDFGFHNAILQPNGRLRFIDFEYAGWDDPAKLVCDFFCQPAVPVPRRQWSTFAQTIAALTPEPMSALQRMELLLPVYRIKWCCIMLNVFLPPGARRRRFAGTPQELEAMKGTQLRKAMRMIAASSLAA